MLSRKLMLGPQNTHTAMCMKVFLIGREGRRNFLTFPNFDGPAGTPFCTPHLGNRAISNADTEATIHVDVAVPRPLSEMTSRSMGCVCVLDEWVTFQGGSQ
jgi:hypothetical protein